MKHKALIRIAIVLIFATVGYFQKDKITGNDPAQPGVGQVASTSPSQDALVIRNLEIRDVDGSIAYRGDVDLAPAIRRIEAGEKDSHPNDGSVFGNHEGKLPRKDRGYYREYVVRTRGIRHAGPQRLVIGREGEVFYTHDHYSTFSRVER